MPEGPLGFGALGCAALAPQVSSSSTHAHTQLRFWLSRVPLQLSAGALQVPLPSHGVQETALTSTQEGGAGLQAAASVGAPTQQSNTQS